jgi:hypothetical protein
MVRAGMDKITRRREVEEEGNEEEWEFRAFVQGEGGVAGGAGFNGYAGMELQALGHQAAFLSMDRTT